MNAYLSSVIENVKTKHAGEPEFVQTVEEVFSSLEPVIETWRRSFPPWSL